MTAAPGTGHHSRVRSLHREIMQSNGWSLRDLYRTLETAGANRLRDAHAALDSAVRAAYGMTAAEDSLAFLLGLNLQLAAQEVAGRAVTPPGFPPNLLTTEGIITGDCIRLP